MPPFQWELTTSALIFEAFRIWEDLLLPYNSWVLTAGESLWTMFHELCCFPVSSWAVEQTLLCMQLISCVAVWQRQQYPSSAVEIHDKLEGPSLGPLGGDTDNYTGAKFRINTSLIVRTSIRRIESAPPSSMHHISCLKICILTPEISSSWEK